jgi:hypothetical protein
MIILKRLKSFFDVNVLEYILNILGKIIIKLNIKIYLIVISVWVIEHLNIYYNMIRE